MSGFQSRMVKLPDIPFVTACDDEHLNRKPFGSTQTYREVREDFLLDVTTIGGRTLASVRNIVERMRILVQEHPDEFTEEALMFIDKLHAEAVAQRLLGGIR